jgi:hypothetical protein
MGRRFVALFLVWSVPGAAVAGPIEEAVAKAAREIALAQETETGGKGGRFWTGVSLLAGGGLLTALGGFEIGDDESGPDDGEDLDDSDDGEDSDVNKAMLGGGIAAAALGSILLLTGRKSGPSVSLRNNGVAVKHTVSF